MAVDRKQANLQMLSEADEIQDKTQETIFRIQRQAAETEEVAALTLEELRKQGQQMDEINAEIDNVSTKLDHSQQLQNKFDAWAGNWFGGKKRAAMKEAAADIATRNHEELMKVKEVFENEKYDPLTRTWKAAGMVLVTNPTMEAPQIFDPAAVSKEANSNWSIDFNLSGIDAEGWTYASDFTVLNTKGVGEAKSKWNSYVRRRKWKYQDRHSSAQSEGLAGVVARQDERNATRKKETTAAAGGATATTQKMGYVPRERVQLQATGFTSAGMAGGRNNKDQELDADSAAGLERLKKKDAVIDSGLDQISGQLDSLNRIAGSMNEEVQSQVAKTERMESSMQRASEKQAVVNARQKKLLATS